MFQRLNEGGGIRRMLFRYSPPLCLPKVKKSIDVVVDVLGRTVRSVFSFFSPFTFVLGVLANPSIARYTDRDNEFITLAGRSG